MQRIADWWDGLELWVAGLPFIPQFVVVLAVVIPLSFGLAWVLDRVLMGALIVLGRGAEPVPSDLDSDSAEGVR